MSNALVLSRHSPSKTVAASLAELISYQPIRFGERDDDTDRIVMFCHYILACNHANRVTRNPAHSWHANDYRESTVAQFPNMTADGPKVGKTGRRVPMPGGVLHTLRTQNLSIQKGAGIPYIPRAMTRSSW